MQELQVTEAPLVFCGNLEGHAEAHPFAAFAAIGLSGDIHNRRHPTQALERQGEGGQAESDLAMRAHAQLRHSGERGSSRSRCYLCLPSKRCVVFSLPPLVSLARALSLSLARGMLQQLLFLPEKQPDETAYVLLLYVLSCCTEELVVRLLLLRYSSIFIHQRRKSANPQNLRAFGAFHSIRSSL